MGQTVVGINYWVVGEEKYKEMVQIQYVRRKS